MVACDMQDGGTCFRHHQEIRTVEEKTSSSQELPHPDHRPKGEGLPYMGGATIPVCPYMAAPPPCVPIYYTAAPPTSCTHIWQHPLSLYISVNLHVPAVGVLCAHGGNPPSAPLPLSGTPPAAHCTYHHHPAIVQVTHHTP